jgi:hypothetical protein
MKHSSFALFLLAAAFVFVPAAHAQQGPPPTCTLSASAGVVQKGGTVNLRWQSSNAVSGTITSIGGVGPSGIQGVIPTQTTEYVGVFAGPGGTTRCSVTIIVTLPTGGTTAPTQTESGPATDVSTAPNTFPTVPDISAGEAVLTSETGGLVPCTGLNCQACHLASLVQNIIKFLIMLAIPLAALLFAVAGAMYFSSEISHKKEKAKEIIKKGVVGFIIALSSWLVVNTVFYILFEPPAGGSWFTVQCVSDSQRPQTGKLGPTVSALIGGAAPPRQIPVSAPTGGVNATPVGECAAGYTFLDGLCYSPDGGEAQAPTYSDLGSAIAFGATAYQGANTSAGPDRGNLACAWAVNNVLMGQGIAAIDGNSVASMERQLQSGRGSPLDQSYASAGDLVIWGKGSHVGICQNAGCTQVLSNSSSNASFTNTVPAPAGSRYYRVTN